MNLVDKYRPQVLADLIGQPWIVSQLEEFVAAPHSVAFLFEGGTGTGKTSAAVALARELGVDVDAGPFGGFHEIAAGEQTGLSVRDTMNALRLHTLTGSGWKVLVVNEADCMTPQAAYIWLDALENLPARSIVVFTTNDAHKIAARLRDRCERFRFESGYIALAPYLPAFIAHVWWVETGRKDAPDLDALGAIQDDAGNVSIRRVLQQLAPLVRAAQAGKASPPPPAAPKAKTSNRAGTLAALADGPATPDAIAKRLGIPRLKSTIWILAKEGLIRAVGDGTYALNH